jgi:hypothetical protein
LLCSQGLLDRLAFSIGQISARLGLDDGNWVALHLDHYGDYSVVI